MTEPLVVGVDLGTQSTKAALFRPGGTCIAEASAPLPLHRRGAEEVYQDPDDFYRATTLTVSACLREGRCDPRAVSAVAVAGQMAGILGIGADGQAVTPYDSWLDSRCRAEVEELAERLGDELVERTGCPAMVAHAPKILWLQRTRPDVYAAVEKFVVPSAFVAGRLCGLRAADAYVDWTHLHFSGLSDAATASWSSELASALDIDLERLPRIVAPTDLVGALTAEAARDCGLLPGTPVAAGLGDTAAGALGAGVVQRGQVLDTAGTASVLAVSTDAFRPDVAARTLVVMRGAAPGQWIPLSYLAGGSLLRWLPQALDGRPAGDSASIDRLIEEAEGGNAGSPLFVPHLGGRLLPAAPEARGGWIGLDLGHRRGDLVRAVLESVAFEYAGFLEQALTAFPDLTPTEVRVIGGGSRDKLWNRIKASVLGLPYLRLERENFSCWGAALVAASAVGIVDDLAAAALQTTSPAERIEPDPRLRAIYAERLQDYRMAVDLLVPEEVLA